MTVVSAGIGDIIKSAFDIVLETNSIEAELLAPLNYVANFGEYGEANTLTTFQTPHVFMANKDRWVGSFLETQQDGSSGHQKHMNVIMMGDIIDDTKMVEWVPYDTWLKIGYLNWKVRMEDKDLIGRFNEAYDIIITNDGNLTLLNKILELIANPEANIEYLKQVLQISERFEVNQQTPTIDWELKI